jgi:hypothetical protein
MSGERGAVSEPIQQLAKRLLSPEVRAVEP